MKGSFKRIYIDKEFFNEASFITDVDVQRAVRILSGIPCITMEKCEACGAYHRPPACKKQEVLLLPAPKVIQ